MRRGLVFLFLITILNGTQVPAMPLYAVKVFRGQTEYADKYAGKLVDWASIRQCLTLGSEQYSDLTAALSLSARAAYLRAPTLQNREDLIRRILSDTRLWGKDFPAVLATLPAFNGAGENVITVLPDRIVGERKFKSLDEAGREAENVSKYLNLGQNKFRPEFEPLFERNFRERAITLKPEAFNFLDDDTKRVGVLRRGSQFLAPGLTIATVRKILGEPEKITREVLDNGERRPIILKIHHYAGGAIAFAVSNWTTRPGDIDRAFLNVPAVTAAIFQETR